MDENASDALKIAAAVLIFVAALSITVIAFTKARQAASSIMSSLAGTQEYYDTSKITLNANEYKITSYRKVGAETIVPTLYAYYKEGYTILFYIGKLDSDGNLEKDSVKPMTLYYSEALKNTSAYSTNIPPLKKSYLINANDASDNERAIYGLDINDELTRQEPWSYNEQYAKRFIECLVNNYGKDDNNAKYYTSKTIYQNYTGSNSYGPYYQVHYRYIDSMNGQTNLINCTHKFIERVGQYNYDAVYSSTNATGSTEGTTQNYNQTNLTGSVITFSNNEVTANTSGNIKRVIQYIYIE